MDEELKRNDTDGALSIWRSMLSRGDLTPDIAQMLLRMQDDPRELMAAFAKACTDDPRVAAKVESVAQLVP